MEGRERQGAEKRERSGKRTHVVEGGRVGTVYGRNKGVRQLNGDGVRAGLGVRRGVLLGSGRGDKSWKRMERGKGG